MMTDLFNEESYLLGVLRTIVASAKASRPSELAQIAQGAIAHVENCRAESKPVNPHGAVSVRDSGDSTKERALLPTGGNADGRS